VAAAASGWADVYLDSVVVITSILSRRDLRFTIPIDTTFELLESWPVVEVILGAQRTADNPYGLAWTYAHGTRKFFSPSRSR
jgi:hypothetical protein